MTMLLSIAVALFAGLMLSRVVKLVKLPAVTGYLIAGLLIGPFVLGRLRIPGLGFISFEEVERLKSLPVQEYEVYDDVYIDDDGDREMDYPSYDDREP